MQDGIPWSSDLLTLARRFGPRIAITDGDASITYAELSARAHGLAVLMGGKIEVVSTPGVGSLFRVPLPLVRA
jgi:non-ribosomal peptide synthetase component E (peptide arylation enzyme)